MAEIVAGQTTDVKKDDEVKKVETPEVKEDVDVEEHDALTTLEESQYKLGWRPLWEFDGEPEEHRSAREFKDRGELLSKISSQSKEIRQVQQAAAALSQHNQNVYKAGYENALKDLKTQRAQAIKNDDVDAQLAIEDRIDQVKDTIQAIKNTPASVHVNPAPSGDFQDFLDKNKWYSDDEDLQFWAHGTAIAVAKKHPNWAEAEVYAYLGEQVKKKFPEKFTGRKGPPSPDGESRRGTGAGSSDKIGTGSGAFEKLMARLPEEHQRTARDLVKRGYVTKEKYVEDYTKLEG